MAMVKEYHAIERRRKEIISIALAVMKEQRKVPGENNAKFCKYCTDLFVHNKETTND
jgi:RNase P subunit RPR2